MQNMEDLTGKQLGPYRVVAPLGEGGMAAVYKAYQAGMDRYVALKILPRQLAGDPQFVGRFTQEARMIARLQHPHILPVHDFGDADGYTYIVMPLVETGTLTDLLTGQPLPAKQIRSLISQIGDALDYAHSLGIIHRDVKPSNVLVDSRGNCLLTDFGIAKMVEGTAQFTTTGGVLGTPAYMSPEQGTGEKVDGRSDIYSLGVILYEMATGRVPFKAETPIAVMIKHIHDPLLPPSSFNPSVPEALERIILKCLAKRPEDRYATAGEMVRALQAALPETTPGAAAPGLENTRMPDAATRSKEAITAASPAGAATAQKKAPDLLSAMPVEARPIPVWVWAAGGLLLVAVGVGIAALVGQPSADGVTGAATATESRSIVVAEPSDTPEPTSTLAPPTDTPTPSIIPGPSPTPTPIGGGNGRIAFSSNREGNFDIYVMNVDGSEPVRLAQTTSNNFPPAWSPDGTRLVYTSDRDGNVEIYVMNADGSGQTRLTNSPGNDQFPAWSPDGRLIAFQSDRNGSFDIYVLNIGNASGNEVNLTNAPSNERFPEWSPDGRQIAFSSDRDDGFDIYTMHSDGTNVIRLTAAAGDDLRPHWSPDGGRIAFGSMRDEQFEIYVMNVDGSDQTRLTDNPAEDFRPVWSPDGSLIAFHSTRDGNYEVYVMNADGSDQRRLTDNPTIDVHPNWQP